MTRPGRFYVASDMGPKCTHCPHKVPAGLGTPTHPTCGPDAAYLLHLDRKAPR